MGTSEMKVFNQSAHTVIPWSSETQCPSKSFLFARPQCSRPRHTQLPPIPAALRRSAVQSSDLVTISFR
jgi:hypothetical protein